MILNDAEINSASLNSPGAAETGALSIQVDFVRVKSTGTLSAELRFKRYTVGTLSAQIDFNRVANSGVVSAELRFKRYTVGTLSAQIDFNRYTPQSSASRSFSVVVTLGGVDISARLTGRVVVEAAEGAARLATFKMLPVAGAIDPYTWIGQTVKMDYIEDGNPTRIFTGTVHVPVFEPSTGLTTFQCTDALQETVELVPIDTVASVTGGHWDKAIFGEVKDGWTYAQQRMTTRAASYDLDPYRKPRITDWAAKATPDFSFGQGEIVAESERIELAERRNIVNSIKLKFAARFNRKWQREIPASWRMPTTFNEWLANPYGLPTDDIINSALGGPVVKSIDFGRLPGSGTYRTGSGLSGASAIAGWHLSDDAKKLITSVYFVLSKRWLQTVTKTHEITLTSAASIAQHGKLEIEHSASIDINNSDDWESYATYSAATGTAIDAYNHIDVSGVDYDNALNTVIAQKLTEILASHRQNRVIFETALHPHIDVIHTVSMALPRLSATGKCSAIRHDIDLDQGTAISEITLSIYRPNAGGQVGGSTNIHTAISLPASAQNATIPLNTYIGVAVGVSDDNEDWQGWVTGYETPVTINASQADRVKVYDKRWSMTVPSVASAERDEATETQADEITVAIPQENLTIQV